MLARNLFTFESCSLGSMANRIPSIYGEQYWSQLIPCGTSDLTGDKML